MKKPEIWALLKGSNCIGISFLGQKRGRLASFSIETARLSPFTVSFLQFFNKLTVFSDWTPREASWIRNGVALVGHLFFSKSKIVSFHALFGRTTWWISIRSKEISFILHFTSNDRKIRDRHWLWNRVLPDLCSCGHSERCQRQGCLRRDFRRVDVWDFPSRHAPRWWRPPWNHRRLPSRFGLESSCRPSNGR